MVKPDNMGMLNITPPNVSLNVLYYVMVACYGCILQSSLMFRSRFSPGFYSCLTELQMLKETIYGIKMKIP